MQGLGAGGLLVLAQAAIGDVVSPRERPRYQGLLRSGQRRGPAAGRLHYLDLVMAMGVLCQPAGWPAGAGYDRARAAAAAVWQGPTDRLCRSALLTGPTAGLLLLLAWGGTEFPWLSPDSAGLLTITVGLAALFVWQENRASEPLIRLPLFRNRIFARGVAVGGMMAFAMLGSTVFLPLYFQLVLGMDPAVAA